MTRRTSKCTFPEQFPACYGILFGSLDMSRKSQFVVTQKLELESRVSCLKRGHTDSGTCRWDSDDLSDVSDEEWDDNA